ncbi:toxic anion resistance protein [Butyricicoccus sp. 1XD8-22]|nr:toxic anion resistance protein [Butyricicoccus sp. 1XD8-22]
MDEKLLNDLGSVEAPSLTLDFAPAEEKPEETAAAPVTVEDTPLSDAERKMVQDFAQQIDLKNSAMILNYGAASQKKIADFSGAALESVRTKDLGEVGDMITGLVTELKGFDATAEQPKGLFGLFKKAGNQLDEMKLKYSKAETNVERITSALEGHQVTLLKDIKMLDKMYEKNLVYFKELSMYILAGKQKLAEARGAELPTLMAKAQSSGLPEDAQAARDFDDLCGRFEKKLYDLELTRTISIQMAPQIRLVQNNDAMMAEKIQSSLVNTIPLWKSQMVLALGLANSQQAIQAQRAVTDMTNELLKKNAAALKMGTIEAAKESERGIVDIETLQQTNRSLIETLDEVLKIQSEGRQKRAAAEEELGKIEGELKQKLLEISTQ